MDDTNQNQKQELVEKLKDAKNILVTVTRDPNVDQLAACLGLTLWLNKVGKHATAVFSGEVPSTLEFLQPDDTLEKNTDSLRDFIISLDKSKADKLRYKVEDSVVKVFVTPYRTSLTADDLEFSQGDFNVDMVIALGVHAQAELDDSITAHGRILHDATVATVTIGDSGSELGAINWHDGQASSLCELIVDFANSVDQQQIDSQIATALLTGVVAETERFSNHKTTPQTMSVSAQLMSVGANQQLVASKLDEPVVEPTPEPEPAPEPQTEPENESQPEESVENNNPAAPAEPVPDDGALSIEHEDEAPVDQQPVTTEKPPEPEAVALPEPDSLPEDNAASTEVSRFADQEPEHGGILTANAHPEDELAEQSSDPFSQPADNQPLLSHTETVIQPADMQPAPPDWLPPQPWMNQPQPAAQPAPEPAAPQFDTEPVPESLPQPQPEQPPVAAGTPDLNAARDEVQKAMEAAYSPAPEPVQALNALPIDLNQPTEQPESAIEATPTIPSTAFNPASFGVMNDPEVYNPQAATTVDPNQPVAPELTGPVEQPFTMPLPSPLAPPPASPTPPTSVEFDPSAPPPVPPPFAPKSS